MVTGDLTKTPTSTMYVRVLAFWKPAVIFKSFLIRSFKTLITCLMLEQNSRFCLFHVFCGVGLMQPSSNSVSNCLLVLTHRAAGLCFGLALLDTTCGTCSTVLCLHLLVQCFCLLILCLHLMVLCLHLLVLYLSLLVQ